MPLLFPLKDFVGVDIWKIRGVGVMVVGGSVKLHNYTSIHTPLLCSKMTHLSV